MIVTEEGEHPPKGQGPDFPVRIKTLRYTF